MSNRPAIYLALVLALGPFALLAQAADPAPETAAANPAPPPVPESVQLKDSSVVAAEPLSSEDLKKAAKSIQQLFADGKNQEAIDAANQYLQNSPHDGQIEFIKAQALTRLSRINEAIAVLQAVTEDSPEMAAPYNNLAVLYASQGRLDDARKALEMVVMVQPNYAVAYENLGDLYAAMARQSYAHAMKLDPKNPTVKAKAAKLN